MSTRSVSAPSPWKRIFLCPLFELARKCLDITNFATPGRFRLLSLVNLRQTGHFEIFEFEELPQSDIPPIQGYTTISCLWRGLPAADNGLPSSLRANSKGNFTVKGGEDADPISISVIEDIAWAALRGGSEFGVGPDRFLWFDQISIIQTSKEDKAWQISRIYSIYNNSRCLILPGGLTRLASVDDNKSWMSRAWTLQEALAPPVILSQDVETSVVFINDPSTHEALAILDKNWGDTPYRTDGTIACAPLMSMLAVLQPLKKSVFGPSEEQVETLLGAITKTYDFSKAYIWRSAFCRASSRPVDMVFSIMQCFGVSLDPKQFDANDQLKATIALAQAILRAEPSGHAYWIPALYFLPPAPELSIFPKFPETRVDGFATIHMPDGSSKQVLDFFKDPTIVKLDRCSHISVYFWLNAGQSMDEDGYYTFVAKRVYALKSAMTVECVYLHVDQVSDLRLPRLPGFTSWINFEQLKTSGATVTLDHRKFATHTSSYIEGVRPITAPSAKR
ncbi:hypothetical protein H0H81_005580 [Sphagnurus paluster]|uniref:Heterokaryon incompatibility domain-containing protein n=1 Tax=Sphagnurus paluster TaxID=117069 RepID=A0A9P7GKG2_9AGAR|nr:hypothetical protein H0H81_005580 [Sphagnurus paluster]